MIRMIQSSSASHAKAYFADALSKADYYIDGQEVNGGLHGQLVQRLGLDEKLSKEIFFALCENRSPIDGKQLTPRTKNDRTVGYDINFHCPKSVSIVHALSKDNHIQLAFEASVNETMLDIQADAQTRVRIEGKYQDRKTNELIWADFTHHTARPVDGHTPDPHLHSHCYVFNMTFDENENRIKAGQFRDIKRDMPYYQARFHKRLSDKLIDLGYSTRLTNKSFELMGVPENVIKHFSKRTDEIGKIAKEKGITDIEELAELGAKTRSKKQKGLSMTDLKNDWKNQIVNIGENKANSEEDLRYSRSPSPLIGDSKKCIDNALEHTFERASVMPDRRILERAYRYGIGDNSISLSAITEEFQKDNRLIHITEFGRSLTTRKDVLAEEMEMVNLARSGQGKLEPIYKTVPLISLTGRQGEAIRDILTNTNQISIIRGAAGSGKTTLLHEAKKHFNNAGKEVFIIAPTAQASRGVLVEEGFQDAETVTKFIFDKSLQNKISNQILWVDEAGLLGTQDMLKIIKITKEQNAKLIFGGDTKQHNSVVRGDALRILNTVAGIKTSEVNRIYRQKNVDYRQAVESLSRGDVREGFDKLNEIGSIISINPLNPNFEIVRDYVDALKRGKSALVISPTNNQGNNVTNEIRIKLRNAGMLGRKELEGLRLVNLNLTDAEKKDVRNYKTGQVIQFNQHIHKFKRGAVCSISSVKDGVIKLTTKNGEQILPSGKSEYYDVYEKSNILLSKGDKIRITKNSFDEAKNRLNNGQSLEIINVTKSGLIKLQNPISKNEYVVNRDFGHLAHSYCVTSYASQGKTVDEVFISQPASTFPATDAKQFYVSVSRGRDSTKIYTDDTSELLRNASELGDRKSAIELVEGYREHMKHKSIKEYDDIVLLDPNRDNLKGYEPEI